MAGRVLREIKERVRDLQLQKAKQRLLMDSVGGHQPLRHVREGRLRQPLDHFNRRRVGTFAQRFFVNEAYWQRPDGPVFLFIGGEGPIYKFDVLAGHHVDMAGEHGALLLAVEHRFYGDSINPDGLETENLADLSSQQALVSGPCRFQSFNLSCRNIWISFGGSYSGALSAWFRGKFPHLVYAAVASSAPVKAKLDFSAYNDTLHRCVKLTLGLFLQCLAAVRDAFSTVEAALMGGNTSQVAADFGCCQIPKDPDDQVTALIFLCVCLFVCLHVCVCVCVQIYRSTNEEPCLEVSHEKAVKDLMDTSLRSGRRAARQWTYQTCTEFGFYQTCEDATCPFSGMLTLQDDTQLCPLLFGISQHSLPARVAFTNAYYGGAKAHTHRVLYINGGIDPWQELSVVSDKTLAEDGEAGTIFIEDTAHCADMMSRRVTDRCSLKKARKEIEKHVAGWLKTAAQEKMEKRGG
uniref:Serine protease 16 n=1 Tax=Echeneis naucrates TaxID=173247 RepID=A0A665VQA6_ECHNA